MKCYDWFSKTSKLTKEMMLDYKRVQLVLGQGEQRDRYNMQSNLIEIDGRLTGVCHIQ